MKIFPLFLLLIFLIGCTSEINDEQESKKAPLVCNPPYIQQGDQCCLDQDRNNLCDTTQNAVDPSTPSNQLIQQPDPSLPINEQTPAPLQFNSDPQTTPPPAQQTPVTQQPPPFFPPAQPAANSPSQSSSPAPSPPSGQASFFITSRGHSSQTGNYGGLNGADAYCQSLGPSGKTWKAYLSTSTEDARNRIGSGPWYNTNGELIASNINQLHTNGIPSNLIYDEQGKAILGNDDSTLIGTDHDVLTGSTSEGRVQTLPSNPDAQATCNDWTSDSDDVYGWQAHADWTAANQQGNHSWNSAHESACSKTGLNSQGGSGKLYCF